MLCTGPWVLHWTLDAALSHCQTSTSTKMSTLLFPVQKHTWLSCHWTSTPNESRKIPSAELPCRISACKHEMDSPRPLLLLINDTSILLQVSTLLLLVQSMSHTSARLIACIT